MTQDTKWKFDLQMFADEDAAGGAAGAVAENNNPDNNSAAAGAAADPAAGNTTENNPAATDKTAPGGKENTILGAGGESKEYDFHSVVPEGMEYDEKSAQAFSTVAKECGLSAKQAQKVAAYGMQYMQQGVAAAQTAIAQQVKNWGEETKTKLGADFDKTVQSAGAGLEALEKVIPGIRAALNETGAGNRLEIVQAFAKMGELVREDDFRGFGSAAGNGNIYNKTDFSKYKN